MPFKMKPNNVICAELGIQDNGPAHKYFTATCARHMDKYTPMDTGALAETVIVSGQPTTNVHNDKIVYNQEYARYVYYGVGLNFQTDKHADAGALWDRRMWSAEKHDITNEMQRYINSGGKQ